MKLYRDPLYFMLYEKVGDQELAKDLTIESLGKAFKKLHLYVPNYVFSTWLFTVARNHCIDYLRKNKLPTVSIDKMMLDVDGKRTNFDLISDMLNPEQEMEKKQRIAILRQIVDQLKPLNPYGDSKNDFDKWVLRQHIKPPFWAGMKFFNVYGPNEYHKGRMASVILHAFRQINRTGEMKLFRSHNPEFEDGKQKRDFIYVKDVVNICHFLMDARPESGLYNVGSGKARTFLDLTLNTFEAMNREKDVSFIDTPEDIRDKYQYFTEASINKLISAGYKKGFHTLEQGVKDYVENYLMDHKYF